MRHVDDLRLPIHYFLNLNSLVRKATVNVPVLDRCGQCIIKWCIFVNYVESMLHYNFVEFLLYNLFTNFVQMNTNDSESLAICYQWCRLIDSYFDRDMFITTHRTWLNALLLLFLAILYMYNSCSFAIFCFCW